MSKRVFVFNDNEYPLRELFKGEEVTILAKDYWRDKHGNKRVVDIFEATDFRGQYHPVPFDGSGKMIADPKHYKIIKMEPVDKAEAALIPDTPSFKCMAKECKHVSPSPEELEAHTNVRHPNSEKLILPDEDARSPKKKTA